MGDPIPSDITHFAEFPPLPAESGMEEAEFSDEADVALAEGESAPPPYPTLDISGFLQFDSVWFDESEASRMAFGDIADSTAVRRARLAVSGDIVEDVGYKLDLDFAASGHPSFRDTFVEIRDRLIAERVVFGFFRMPFQMDALTSAKDFTFAELAPSFTFSPFQQMGLKAGGSLLDERATWTVAGFRTGTDGFAVAQSDDGYGLAARSTILPWHETDGLRWSISEATWPICNRTGKSSSMTPNWAFSSMRNPEEQRPAFLPWLIRG